MYKFNKVETEVLEALAKLDRWSIVGAKALSYYGVHRFTKDTDILCHTDTAKDILEIFKQQGFNITYCDISQVNAVKGGVEFDILITSAPEYSNALTKQNGTYYTTCSGLLDMYLLSDKEQNQFDAVRLLQNNTCKPSEEVIRIEFDRYQYLLEKSKEDIKYFKPRLLADEFNLEELLLELDDID